MAKLGLTEKRKDITKGKYHNLLKRVFLSFNNVDWKKTKAYALGNAGQIYINLKGREPQGSVDPVDYIKTREIIFNELLKMEDVSPEKYELKNQISLRDDIFSGRYLSAMPDLVLWPKESFYDSLGSYIFSSSNVFDITYSPTATHRIDGIFIGYGNGIKRESNLEKVNITDMTPTILNLMGIEVEEDFDGRILSEIFKSQKKETTIKLSKKMKDERAHYYSKEETERIKKSLEGLGYIG